MQHVAPICGLCGPEGSSPWVEHLLIPKSKIDPMVPGPLIPNLDQPTIAPL